MRVYIGGPMTGYPDLNRPAFARAERDLVMWGYDAVNPHYIEPDAHPGRPCPVSYAQAEKGHTAACWLKPAMRLLLTCDTLYLLAGWQASIGATAELNAALAVSMPIFFQVTPSIGFYNGPKGTIQKDECL